MLNISATNFHSSINVFSSSVACTFWLNTRISFITATPSASVEFVFPGLVVHPTESISMWSSGIPAAFICSDWLEGFRTKQEKHFLMIFSHLGNGRMGRTWYIFITSNCMSKLIPQMDMIVVKYIAATQSIHVIYLYRTILQIYIVNFTRPDWVPVICNDIFKRYADTRNARKKYNINLYI